jgi:hypothetical protein
MFTMKKTQYLKLTKDVEFHLAIWFNFSGNMVFLNSGTLLREYASPNMFVIT